LHNDELHNKYFSPIIIRMMKSRKMRWAGHVARMVAKTNANMVLARKPGGRHRRKWEYKIKMSLEKQYAGCELDWLRIRTRGRLM
jgi:hypothetical protein